MTLQVKITNEGNGNGGGLGLESGGGLGLESGHFEDFGSIDLKGKQ